MAGWIRGRRRCSGTDAFDVGISQDPGIDRFLVAQSGRCIYGHAGVVCLQGELRRSNRSGNGTHRCRRHMPVAAGVGAGWLGLAGHHRRLPRVGHGQQSHSKNLGCGSGSGGHGQRTVRRAGQHACEPRRRQPVAAIANRRWSRRHRISRLRGELVFVRFGVATPGDCPNGSIFLRGAFRGSRFVDRNAGGTVRSGFHSRGPSDGRRRLAPPDRAPPA